MEPSEEMIEISDVKRYWSDLFNVCLSQPNHKGVMMSLYDVAIPRETGLLGGLRDQLGDFELLNSYEDFLKGLKERNYEYEIPWSGMLTDIEPKKWEELFQLMEDVCSTYVTKKNLREIWNRCIFGNRIRNSRYFYRVERTMNWLRIHPADQGILNPEKLGYNGDYSSGTKGTSQDPLKETIKFAYEKLLQTETSEEILALSLEDIPEYFYKNISSKFERRTATPCKVLFLLFYFLEDFDAEHLAVSYYQALKEELPSLHVDSCILFFYELHCKIQLFPNLKSVQLLEKIICHSFANAYYEIKFKQEFLINNREKCQWKYQQKKTENLQLLEQIRSHCELAIQEREIHKTTIEELLEEWFKNKIKLQGLEEILLHAGRTLMMKKNNMFESGMNEYI